MSYQRPKPTPTGSTIASVATSSNKDTNNNQGNRNARNQRGGRGSARARGRGGRNQGRGGGRGNSGHRGGRNKSRDDHEDRVQKDYSKDKLLANQCAFYRKKGHYQANYHLYKKFQAQVIQEQEAKGEGKAQGNVAITATRISADQIKEAGFPYLTTPQAMPLVTSHKYALYTINKV